MIDSIIEKFSKILTAVLFLAVLEFLDELSICHYSK